MLDFLKSYGCQVEEDVRDYTESMKSFFSQEKEKIGSDNFFKHLPYQEFDKENGLFVNKNTIGFILRVSVFTGIDISTLDSLMQIISYEIPKGCCVQVINYASPKIGSIVDHWYSASSAGDLFETINRKRKEFFNNKAWKNDDDFVLRDFELILSFSFDKVIGNKRLLYEVLAFRSKIKRAFTNLKCAVLELSWTELEQFINEIISPSYSVYRTPEYAPSSTILMHKDCLKIETKEENFKYLIFEVVNWPEVWRIQDSINYTGDFVSGRGFAFPFYITFGFKLEDGHASERKADKMRLLKTNQASSKLLTFFPAMAQEVEDWRYVSEQIAHGAKLAKALMYIVICVPDDKKDYAQGVIDHFYRLHFKIEKVEHDCANTFINTLPFGMLENWQLLEQLKVPSTMLTSACVSLLPIFADSQNYRNPLMMLLGKRGQIFFFDCFTNQEDANGNYNMIVVGKSGSGKSVFLQEYMVSILRLGGQVVVVDDGRSFKNSCTLLKGDFVDFAIEDLCINPFSLYKEKKDLTDNFKVDFEEPLIDLIVSILCIISNLDKNNTDNFDVGLCRHLLKKAVQNVLIEHGASGGFKNVKEQLETNSELRTTQTLEIASKLSFVLTEYADGRYARCFNGESTLSINNMLTVFELSSLESNEILQTSVLLMVVFLVYVKMQGRDKRTSLIIDEAWRLLRHNAIKSFIEGIARRARKYNGNLVVATQSVTDFDEKNSQAAAAVLSQSDWRVLLSAEGRDEKILKSQLSMDEWQINIAQKLRGSKGKYSEFMLRHSRGAWQIARLMLDPFSAKLYSSKAEDVIAIRAMQNKGFSLTEAIEKTI